MKIYGKYTKNRNLENFLKISKLLFSKSQKSQTFDYFQKFFHNLLTNLNFKIFQRIRDTPFLQLQSAHLFFSQLYIVLSLLLQLLVEVKLKYYHIHHQNIFECDNTIKVLSFENIKLNFCFIFFYQLQMYKLESFFQLLTNFSF